MSVPGHTAAQASRIQPRIENLNQKPDSQHDHRRHADNLDKRDQEDKYVNADPWERSKIGTQHSCDGTTGPNQGESGIR